MARNKPAMKNATFVVPMKALSREEVPTGGAKEWHSEIKYDGYRAVAVVNGGSVNLLSRNHKPLDYPEIAKALESVKCRSAVLDGEIVAFDSKGRSRFQLLQGREQGERPPICFYIFDLLFLNGHSYEDEPFEQRRAALETLLKKVRDPVRISPTFDTDPKKLLAETKRHGLEGIILKRAGSVYEPGRRSGAWLKVKNVKDQELVIGGYTLPRNSREHFGAILVGYYKDKELTYAGKVGTGFDSALLASLHGRFQKIPAADCPFTNLPLNNRSRFSQGMTPSVMRSVKWLKPRLVAQIKFAEWTEDGLLRQPVFLGLRGDKKAAEVCRES